MKFKDYFVCQIIIKATWQDSFSALCTVAENTSVLEKSKRNRDEGNTSGVRKKKSELFQRENNMCIAVFLWQAHPLYPFLLLLNRDEYHSRLVK